MPVLKARLTVEYHGIAPGMERDVFQRVQMGMPLTAAGMSYLKAQKRA